MRRLRWIFVAIILLQTSIHVSSSPESHAAVHRAELAAPTSCDECLCSTGNEVVSCKCDDQSLDHFNDQFHDQLNAILHRPYFRYFKVNLDRSCPFWEDHGEKCSMPDCSVKTCSAEELPVSLRDLAASTVQAQVAEACAQEEELSSVDYSLNADQRAEIIKWDDLQDGNFCVVDDEGASDCTYIDLSKNPERLECAEKCLGWSIDLIWKLRSVDPLIGWFVKGSLVSSIHWLIDWLIGQLIGCLFHWSIGLIAC